MKISTIRAFPLIGRTAEAGWEDRLDPEENVLTLIEVATDEGLTGIGSAYTSLALVEGRCACCVPGSLVNRLLNRRGWRRSCTRCPSGRGAAAQ